MLGMFHCHSTERDTNPNKIKKNENGTEESIQLHIQQNFELYLI